LRVKWEESIAWGTGYQGQIFLNVKGREEKGVVEPDEYDNMLDQIINDLKKIPDKDGKKLDTEIVKRKDVYHGPLARFAPDLFTYFGKMHWAISPLVGRVHAIIPMMYTVASSAWLKPHCRRSPPKIGWINITNRKKKNTAAGVL